MTAPPGELLAAEGVEARYGERTVLSVERLSVREGEVLAVLGPNGAGKSTLLRILAMLERPHAGRVVFRGAAGPAAERALRRASAAVFQRPHLWAGSVRYNVELGLRLAGARARERRERAEAWARQLGIAELLEADARTLSGGEAQRVALARALARDPDVLFLDEPTANLDAEVRRALREDLERAARRAGGASGGRSAGGASGGGGLTSGGDASGAGGGRPRSTVLATHDRAEALYLADRIVVLRGGRIVQAGRPAELYENPADPYIAQITGAELSLVGRVDAADGGTLAVQVEGTLLQAVGRARPGDRVKLAYRPEDLLLTPEPPGPSSARNRLPARVLEVREVGGLLRVRLAGPPEMIAVVTRAAGSELGLEPGARVHVSLKATALHAFPL